LLSKVDDLIIFQVFQVGDSHHNYSNIIRSVTYNFIV